MTKTTTVSNKEPVVPPRKREPAKEELPKSEPRIISEKPVDVKKPILAKGMSLAEAIAQRNRKQLFGDVPEVEEAEEMQGGSEVVREEKVKSSNGLRATVKKAMITSDTSSMEPPTTTTVETSQQAKKQETESTAPPPQKPTEKGRQSRSPKWRRLVEGDRKEFSFLVVGEGDVQEEVYKEVPRGQRRTQKGQRGKRSPDFGGRRRE